MLRKSVFFAVYQPLAGATNNQIQGTKPKAFDHGLEAGKDLMTEFRLSKTDAKDRAAKILPFISR